MICICCRRCYCKLQLQKKGAHTNHFGGNVPRHAHTPTHTHSLPSKWSLLSKYRSQPPIPPVPPSPPRPVPACKLIHLRVVAGLQRDLVIVSPTAPAPSSSPAIVPSFMCRHPTPLIPYHCCGFRWPTTKRIRSCSSCCYCCCCGQPTKFSSVCPARLNMQSCEAGSPRNASLIAGQPDAPLHLYTFPSMVFLCIYVCVCVCFYVFCGQFVSAIPQRVGL